MTNKAPYPQAKSDGKNSCRPGTNVVQIPVETLVARKKFRDLERFIQILKDFKVKNAAGISVLSLDGNTASTVDICY